MLWYTFKRIRKHNGGKQLKQNVIGDLIKSKKTRKKTEYWKVNN